MRDKPNTVFLSRIIPSVKGVGWLALLSWFQLNSQIQRSPKFPNSQVVVGQSWRAFDRKHTQFRIGKNRRAWMYLVNGNGLHNREWWLKRLSLPSHFAVKCDSIKSLTINIMVECGIIHYYRAAHLVMDYQMSTLNLKLRFTAKSTTTTSPCATSKFVVNIR